MCGSNAHFLQNEILRQYWESTALIRVHQSEFCSKDLLPLYQKKPSERFELSTPGLQDQCSNPWATKAMHLVGKTKWRYCLAICVCLLLIPTIRLSFAFFEFLYIFEIVRQRKFSIFFLSDEKWFTVPWPGFEPGLLRPQRNVLTTIRSRRQYNFHELPRDGKMV